MNNPVVTISDGQLKGKCAKDFQGGSFLGFLGIPYAQAPIGELRFKVKCFYHYFMIGNGRSTCPQYQNLLRR